MLIRESRTFRLFHLIGGYLLFSVQENSITSSLIFNAQDLSYQTLFQHCEFRLNASFKCLILNKKNQQQEIEKVWQKNVYVRKKRKGYKLVSFRLKQFHVLNTHVRYIICDKKIQPRDLTHSVILFRISIFFKYLQNIKFFGFFYSMLARREEKIFLQTNNRKQFRPEIVFQYAQRALNMVVAAAFIQFLN